MYLGTVKIDDTISIGVACINPSNGRASDADSKPIYRIYIEKDGTLVYIGELDKRDGSNTTGFYLDKVVISTVNGFITGKHYTIYIEYLVDGNKVTCLRNFRTETILSR
jgi:hypothetical protein